MSIAVINPFARAADYTPDSAISTDAVGELVDVVKMGAEHWSHASGDPNPDLLSGIQDVDDSFGQHKGRLKNSQSFELRNSEATMVVRAPEGGRYALCVRVRTGKDRRGAVEYMRGKGESRSFLVAKATYLSVGEKELFQANATVSVAVDAKGAGAVDGPAAGYTLTRTVDGKQYSEELKGRSALKPM